MAEFISAPLALAAEQFAKLPGIGIKTAQRLAYGRTRASGRANPLEVTNSFVLRASKVL